PLTCLQRSPGGCLCGRLRDARASKLTGEVERAQNGRPDPLGPVSLTARVCRGIATRDDTTRTHHTAVAGAASGVGDRLVVVAGASAEELGNGATDTTQRIQTPEDIQQDLTDVRGEHAHHVDTAAAATAANTQAGAPLKEGRNLSPR